MWTEGVVLSFSTQVKRMASLRKKIEHSKPGHGFSLQSVSGSLFSCKAARHTMVIALRVTGRTCL